MNTNSDTEGEGDRVSELGGGGGGGGGLLSGAAGGMLQPAEQRSLVKHTAHDLPSSPIRTSCKKKCLYICCGMAAAAIVVLLAFTGAVFAVIGVNGYPIHASCHVTWSFPVSCSNASKTIVNQIHAWEGKEGCQGGGQRCLYSLTDIENNGTLIKAKHTTPVNSYVDDLTFEFHVPGNSDKCICKGFSTSETWYAILDYGTNYCNLHNLVTGAGLDKLKGYKEDTSNKQCTQFLSANCDKY